MCSLVVTGPVLLRCRTHAGPAELEDHACESAKWPMLVWRNLKTRPRVPHLSLPMRAPSVDRSPRFPLTKHRCCDFASWPRSPYPRCPGCRIDDACLGSAIATDFFGRNTTAVTLGLPFVTMADNSTRFPHTHYLVSRWAPERGMVSADGFQWLEERLQEARNSLVKPNKARFGSQNRSSGLDDFLGGNMTSRGGALGFASVTNGLENPQREIRDTKEKVLAKAEEFGDKAEELGEEAKEFAMDHRVPVPEIKLPFIGPVKSLVLKQLLCGIIAGGVAGTLITPLEIIKTRVMGGQGGRTVGQVVNRVTQEEGIQSVMLMSFSISVIRTALDKGVQFATFEAVKRTEKRRHIRDPKVLPLPRAIPIATLAGAAAGFTSTFFVYPFMVLNDRIVLNSDAYKGFGDAFIKILKNEGLQELMRGITPSLIKMVPNAAASFYTYETLKDQYLQERGKKHLDNWASLTIGAAAAAVGTTLTYPLEVARREISLSALPNEVVHVGRNLQYTNVFEALRGIVKNEGVGALYRGLPLEFVEIVPMTAITFAVYEAAKRAFIAINEERRDEVKGGPDE